MLQGENYRNLNNAIWGDKKTISFELDNPRYTNAIVGAKNNAGKEIPITVSESFNYSAFNKYVPEMPEVVEVRTNIMNKYRSF